MAATENHRGNGRRQAWVVAAASLVVPALIVFIAAAYGFGWRWTGFPGQTLFDWFKILVFPAAVALGTVLLNYLVKATEDARDRSRARNEDRKAILTQVIAAYNETK